jgi:cob(I)alamin adenosyltransferase
VKVYTKTGDKGTTGLLGGTRVSKSDIRIEAYGNVDELNSWIGLLRDLPVNDKRQDLLTKIQDRLFVIGSWLAMEGIDNIYNIPEIKEADIKLLENEMDSMDELLPPLKNFVLPGGDTSVSYAHIARTVCRRAERQVIRLAEVATISEIVIKYLNRLSDFLFVLSRKLTLELNVKETYWISK